MVDSYKRLRRLQDQDIENKLKNRSLSPAQERKYKNLKDKIIAEVKSLRLNPARIDSLVEQLYEINRRLVGYEGRMMRLAESHGVAREDFLKNYFGSPPLGAPQTSDRGFSATRSSSPDPEPALCFVDCSLTDRTMNALLPSLCRDPGGKTMSHQRTRRESGQVDRDRAPTYASLASNAARLAVGAGLRRSFSDALREPIPDRIAELLKLLD